MPYEDEALAPWHDCESFNCRNPTFGKWLRDSALTAQRNHTARTFVWHSGDNQVAGYYSLAMHAVGSTELPPKVARGGPDLVPVVLLAKLAHDLDEQHRGIGGEMLWNALTRAVDAERLVAARAVVVDAVDEFAATFYGDHGFLPLPENPLRMARKMSDVVVSVRPLG